jgi:hypothetical protein
MRTMDLSSSILAPHQPVSTVLQGCQIPCRQRHQQVLVNSIELLAILTLILIGDTLEADSGAPNKIKWLTGQKARR